MNLYTEMLTTGPVVGGASVIEVGRRTMSAAGRQSRLLKTGLQGWRAAAHGESSGSQDTGVVQRSNSGSRMRSPKTPKIIDMLIKAPKYTSGTNREAVSTANPATSAT